MYFLFGAFPTLNPKKKKEIKKEYKQKRLKLYKLHFVFARFLLLVFVARFFLSFLFASACAFAFLFRFSQVVIIHKKHFFFLLAGNARQRVSFTLASALASSNSLLPPSIDTLFLLDPSLTLTLFLLASVLLVKCASSVLTEAPASFFSLPRLWLPACAALTLTFVVCEHLLEL